MPPCILQQMFYLNAVEDTKQVLQHKRLFVDSKHPNQPSDPKYRHKDAYAPNTRPLFVLNKMNVRVHVKNKHMQLFGLFFKNVSELNISFTQYYTDLLVNKNTCTSV